MRKLLLGIVMVVFIGALALGATGAFYSDTETSTGNILVAGSIDLTVNSQGSSYNGGNLQGTNFPAKDLEDEHFFVFDDIKPGDYGIRNISLHAADNPAYACLLIRNKQDDENVRTDPEIDAGDVTDDPNGGELSKELELFAWEDRDGDQQYEPVGNSEPGLINDGGTFDADSFFDITYEIFFDSTSGIGPLIQNFPRNIGLAWCAGTLNVNHATGAISCDGSGMGDIAQSDTFAADIILYAEQTRNNDSFECADVVLP